MMNRSIKDGSPRLLFDYVLKDMDIQISKPQYHGMMSVQAAWKFLELSRIHRRHRPSSSVLARPRYTFHAIFVEIVIGF